MAITSKKSVSKKTKTARKSSPSITKKTTTRKVTNATKKPVKKTAVKTAVVNSKPEATKTVVATNVETKKVRVVSGAIRRLRSLNLFVALANAVQAGLILYYVKSEHGIREVSTTFTTSDSLASAGGQTAVVSATHRLFDVHLSWLLAAVFIVSALAHLSVATWMRRRYEREVDSNINRVRWATCSITTSLTMVVIALLSGVSDIATLIVIIAATVVAHLVALSLEHYKQNNSKTRLGWTVGAIAALIPWAILAIYAFSAHQFGNAGLPKFVYYVYLSAAIIYVASAMNLYRQSKGLGRWIDYLYVERSYIIISLIANAAIAWQVYAGTLRK